MKVLYEDNHIIIVNKAPGEIVQGDKTGDKPLCDIVREWLKAKYDKPGNVFLGVVHRLDRPVTGAVLFAKTSKALSRIVGNRPPQESGTLTHWLTRNGQTNTARAYDREVPGSKKAILDYRIISSSDKYFLLEVTLHTGRHHQIRCQLSKIGCPIRGDLKYGAPRSNPDGSISLHARSLSLTHPVSMKPINVVAPVPDTNLWKAF